jgi:hypothetical protein
VKWKRSSRGKAKQITERQKKEKKENKKRLESFVHED